MDRERGGLLGITASLVGRAVTAATSSSRYVVPNYWADPTTGIAYQVQVEVPQQQMNSIEEVKNIPVSTTSGGTTLLLRNIANVQNSVAAAEYDRFNSQRMITLTANISGADLGSRCIATDDGDEAGRCATGKSKFRDPGTNCSIPSDVHRA